MRLFLVSFRRARDVFSLRLPYCSIAIKNSTNDIHVQYVPTQGAARPLLLFFLPPVPLRVARIEHHAAKPPPPPPPPSVKHRNKQTSVALVFAKKKEKKVLERADVLFVSKSVLLKPSSRREATDIIALSYGTHCAAGALPVAHTLRNTHAPEPSHAHVPHHNILPHTSLRTSPTYRADAIPLQHC